MIAYFLKPAYASLVADKDATGFGDSNKVRRTTATWRYFFVRLPLRALSQWAGRGGDTFGYAGCLLFRFANPAMCPPSRLATGCGFSNPKEDTMSSIVTPVLSHSEQIRRLAGIADTIGSMLSVYALLPESGQTDALAVSASLADELAQTLAAIAGSAA